MKILFVVPSYKPAYIYGGPVVVIAELAETLVRMGHSVTVYTTTANGKTELEMTGEKPVLVDGVSVHYFRRITKDHTHISPALWNMLDRHVRAFDAVHVHSWWNFLVLGAVAVCKKHGIKPTLSPHGMFSDYILETNNSMKKKVIHGLFGKRLLKNTFLHTSTQMEWNECLRANPDWQGAIVPNLVTLPTEQVERPVRSSPTRIGFLSRIDPKKGLDVLIKTLARVNFDFQLLVAGSGSEAYVRELKDLAVAEGISDKIEWVGWKNGIDKFHFLAGLDFFILTSHSENFAIVVIESLSVGTPVIISDNVGLYQYVKEHDYGWVVPMDIPRIVRQLDEIVSGKEKEKIVRINQVVPDVIRDEFKDTHLAARYLEMYRANSRFKKIRLTQQQELNPSI